MRKNKIIGITLVILISSISYIVTHKVKPVPTLVTHNLSFKISTDKKEIDYQGSASEEWRLLLKISDVRRDILDLLLMHIPVAFQNIIKTPNQNKIIIQVSDDMEELGDFTDNWYLIYDLVDKTQIDLPGNNFYFSKNKKYIFSSYTDPHNPVTTNYYLISLATGKVLESLKIDRDHDDKLIADSNIKKLLNAHDIEMPLE
jgi:hypothetical protein